MPQTEKSVHFLSNDVPLILAKLKDNSTPLWGKMTAQQMVEHLQFSLFVSTGAKLLKLNSSWYSRPFYKFYLLSSLPFPKQDSRFDLTNGDLPPLKYQSLAEAKAHLIQSIEDTLYFLNRNPEVRINHPVAGYFNNQNWRFFHEKHFRHHFSQFGLLPE